ncbi:hypothetical protein Tco_0712520 [Tanacetum coccineum]
MARGKGKSFVISKVKEIIVLSSDSDTSLKSTNLEVSSSSDDIVSTKRPSKAMVCREESDSNISLKSTILELSSSLDDIVSREGPSKVIVSREEP